MAAAVVEGGRGNIDIPRLNLRLKMAAACNRLDAIDVISHAKVDRGSFRRKAAVSSFGGEGRGRVNADRHWCNRFSNGEF